jgi:hypothetical protein
MKTSIHFSCIILQINEELHRSRSIYKMLIFFLTIFTILDVIITRIGLNIGCIELNVFVNNLGLDLWTIFRLLLLFYLITVYSIGYQMLKSRSSRGFWMLKNSLYPINIFIGAIVFSGFFHIITILNV